MPKNHTTVTVEPLIAPFDTIEAELREMVEDTIARCTVMNAEPDDTFGDYASLFSLAKAAQSLEGNLIRDAVAALVRTAGLEVIGEIKLPVTRGALEAAKANDAQSLTGIRLDPLVYAEDSYRADLVIADASKSQAWLVELKRATANYGPGKLRDLRLRLTAAAFMVPALLWRDHRIPVRSVEVSILDAADSDRRPGSCAVRLSRFEALLGIPGLTDALAWVRRTYAERFRAEARRQIALVAGADAQKEKDPAGPTAEVGANADVGGHADGSSEDGFEGFPNWPITISLGGERRPV